GTHVVTADRNAIDARSSVERRSCTPAPARWRSPRPPNRGSPARPARPHTRTSAISPRRPPSPRGPRRTPATATGTESLSKQKRPGDLFAAYQPASRTCRTRAPCRGTSSLPAGPCLGVSQTSARRSGTQCRTLASPDSSSAARSPRRSATGRTQPLRLIRSAYFSFCFASRPRSTASGFSLEK
ncbi:unnamed protein product, partial [Pelagomonas calceolata]